MYLKASVYLKSQGVQLTLNTNGMHRVWVGNGGVFHKNLPILTTGDFLQFQNPYPKEEFLLIWRALNKRFQYRSQL